MPALQYVPAEEAGWLVMAANSTVLFLDVGTGAGVDVSQQHVDEVWAALSSQATPQVMLDVLTRGGISSTPHFALLASAGDARQWQGSVQLLVRGAVTVNVDQADGCEKISGQGTTTWREAAIEAANSFEIEPDDVTASLARVNLSLPLAGGAAFARRVIVRSAAPTVLMPMSESSMTPPPANASDIDDKTISLKALAEEARARGGDHDGKTVIGVDDAARHAAREARAERLAASSSGAPQAAGSRMASEQHAASDEFSEETFVIQRGANFGRAAGSAQSDATEQPVPASRQMTASMAIDFSSGTTEMLDQTILVGRAPSVSKVSGASLPRLVTLSGPDQDISRNHVQVAFEGGTVVVTDLHSRNGTLVNLPGRAPLQLRAGEPTPVIAGTLVDLGGGVTFTVRAL